MQKFWMGGEDAYLCSDEMVVVADGVGGWAKKGVDVSLFSREFVFLVKHEYFSRRRKG